MYELGYGSSIFTGSFSFQIPLQKIKDQNMAFRQLRWWYRALAKSTAKKKKKTNQSKPLKQNKWSIYSVHKDKWAREWLPVSSMDQMQKIRGKVSSQNTQGSYKTES